MSRLGLLIAFAACADHDKPAERPAPSAPVDAAIDAASSPDQPDPCASCTAKQICVQSYTGNCGLRTRCVPRTVDCPDHACSAACEKAYCDKPFQCQNRVPCRTESPLAFTCYGP